MMDRFVRYVGPTSIRDAVVQSVEMRDNQLAVVLVTQDEQTALRLLFRDVAHVEQERPVGMRLYALAELRSEDGTRRRFSFANSDEDSTCRLALLAADVRWDRYRKRQLDAR